MKNEELEEIRKYLISFDKLCWIRMIIIITSVLICVALLSGCMGVRGNHTETVEYLRPDGSVEQVQTNERKACIMSLWYDVDLSEVNWGEFNAKQYSGQTSPELAAAIEALDIKGIVRVLTLLDPGMIATLAGAVGQVVK